MSNCEWYIIGIVLGLSWTIKQNHYTLALWKIFLLLLNNVDD